MWQILSPFIMLALLIFFGSFLYFRKLLDLEFVKELSTLVVKVTFPALLFSNMYNNINLASLKTGWPFTIVGLITSIVLAFTANYQGKRLNLDQKSFGTFQILCTNGNNIFLPVPIILTLFGPEYLVYAFLFELGASLFYWSYGVSHFREGTKFDLKRLLNQNMVALVLGLIMGLLPLKLPSPLINSLELLGGVSIVLAMLTIGSLLANLIRTKKLWRQEVLGIILHRLILSPLIGSFALLFFRFSLELKSILFLMLLMPPLITTALVAVNYGGDEELATLGVVIPTLLSFLIVPLVLSLLF